jgi:hypothetical protein
MISTSELAIGNYVKKMLKLLLAWIAGLFDIKEEYGLTVQEIAGIVRLASQGEAGRDMAERLACTGHGLRTSEFYELMDSYGVPCK